MDIIFFLIIASLLCSFTAVVFITIRQWRGWWRLAAVLPAAVMLIVVLNILIGIRLDRTAHNLWPLEIVMWCAGGLLYLGVIILVRKLLSRCC